MGYYKCLSWSVPWTLTPIFIDLRSMGALCNNRNEVNIDSNFWVRKWARPVTLGKPALSQSACMTLISGQFHHHMDPVSQDLSRSWGSPALESIMGMMAWRCPESPKPKACWATVRSKVLTRTPPFLVTAQNQCKPSSALNGIILWGIESGITYSGQVC